MLKKHHHQCLQFFGLKDWHMDGALYLGLVSCRILELCEQAADLLDSFLVGSPDCHSMLKTRLSSWHTQPDTFHQWMQLVKGIYTPQSITSPFIHILEAAC